MTDSPVNSAQEKDKQSLLSRDIFAARPGQLAPQGSAVTRKPHRRGHFQQAWGQRGTPRESRKNNFWSGGNGRAASSSSVWAVGTHAPPRVGFTHALTHGSVGSTNGSVGRRVPGTQIHRQPCLHGHSLAASRPSQEPHQPSSLGPLCHQRAVGHPGQPLTQVGRVHQCYRRGR